MSKFTKEESEFLENNVVFSDVSDLSEEEKEDAIKRYGKHGYMHIELLRCDVTDIGGSVYGDIEGEVLGQVKGAINDGGEYDFFTEVSGRLYKLSDQIEEIISRLIELKRLQSKIKRIKK